MTIEDDEEVLRRLIRHDDLQDDSLVALVDRFRKDNTSNAHVWDEILHQVNTLFPEIQYQTNGSATTSHHTSALSHTLPESLDNDSGKLHVKAAASILHITETEAAELTMMGYSSVGTLQGLVNTIDIYHKQRNARVSTIAELLRQYNQENNDDNNSNDNVLSSILDSVDETITYNEEPRGIFRILLIVACQPDIKIIREDYVPALQLCDENEDEWKHFLHTCLERRNEFCNMERKEAMEALVFLLFDKLQVKYADLAILLTSFGNFNTSHSILASLIFVEAMALWRMNGQVADEWRDDHPLLKDPSAIPKLIQILHNSKSESPLATLAFGLLLKGAAENNADESWYELGRTGSTLARKANDDLDAFGVLFRTMETMVDPPKQSNNVDEEVEQDTNSFAYASIGRELLHASVYIFQDAILPRNKVPQPSNVGQLASLASVIFQNIPTLCKLFWSDWEEFTSDNENNADGSMYPLCRLLDGCYRLAKTAIHATGYDPGSKIQAIAPLFQMASSLTFDAISVESILAAIISNDMIRTVLNLLRRDKGSDASYTILKSIAAMARVGTMDATCRELLRVAVHDPVNLALLRHASVFSILADLTTVDPPLAWLIENVRALGTVQSDIETLLQSGEEQALRFVHSIILNLNKLIFSDKEDGMAVEILDVVQTTIINLSNALPTSFTKTSRYPSKSVCYEFAASIMDCIGKTLEKVNHIRLLHKAERVRNKAESLLNIVIENFRSCQGFEEALCFFACAPVVFALAKSLDMDADERVNDTEPLSGEEDGSMFTASHGISRPDQENLTHRARIILPKKLSELGSSDESSIDIWDPTIWLEQGVDLPYPFSSAFRAISLLNNWSAYLETKMTDENRDSGDKEIYFLSPCRLIFSGAILPPNWRGRQFIHSVWSTSKIIMIYLLPAYLNYSRVDNVGAELAREAFKYLSTSLLCNNFTPVEKSNLENILQNKSFSVCLFKVFKDFQQSLATIVDKQEFDILDSQQFATGLWYLRFCYSITQSNPSFMVNLFATESGSSLLVSFLKITRTLLKSCELLSAKPFSLVNMELTCGYLTFILSLWRYTRMNTMDKLVVKIMNATENERNAILAGILTFVIDDHKEALSDKGLHASMVSYEYMRLTTICLEILDSELLWVQRQANDHSNFFILSELKMSSRSNVKVFVDITKSFLTIEGFSSFPALCHLLEIDKIETLRMLKLQDRIGETLKSFSGPTWQWNLVSRSSFSVLGASVDGILKKLLFEYQVVEGGICRALAWTKFVRRIVLMPLVWPDCSEFNLFGDSRPTLSCKVALAALRCTKINSDVLEQHSPDASLILAREGLRMCFLSSELMASTLRSCSLIDTSPANDYVDSFDDLAQVAKNVGSSTLEFSMDILKLLFFAGTQLCKFSLEKDLLSSESFGIRQRMESILVDLTSTVCWALRRAGKEINIYDDFESLFIICITLIGYLVELGSKQSRQSLSGDGFLRKLRVVLEESDFIRSSLAQADHQSDKLYPENRQATGSKKQPFLLSYVYDLFTKIAAVGGDDFLSLLSSKEAALLQSTSRIAFSLQHSRNFNDYLNSEMAGLKVVQVREAWFTGADLIAVCLRSCRNAAINGETKDRFRRLGINFLKENSELVVSSLNQCSLVEFGPKAKNDNYLTSRHISEATSILAIIAELCSDSVGLLMTCPELFHAVQQHSSLLVGNFGTFLGASSTSREIFRELEEADENDRMIEDQRANSTTLSPVQRLLAGGLTNARYEAIKFSSHFTLNCCMAISEAEKRSQKVFSGRWRPNSLGVLGSSDSTSMQSLEQKCRSGVTSDFSFEIEAKALKCLFFALKILYAVHPASDSFVMFTEEEVKRLDCMSLVFPDTVIAFRRSGNKKGNISGNFTVHKEGMNKLFYGRVVASDTIGRRWQIQRIKPNGESEDCVVDHAQLVGIEDIAKRVAQLPFTPAPETSSDLDSLGRHATVGHLIMTLRWCCQISVELDENAYPCLSAANITRLAEITSALLGLELQLYEEKRARQKLSLGSTPQEKIVADQILDLFGEANEFETNRIKRVGRLRKIMDDKSWSAFRSQALNFLSLVHGNHDLVDSTSMNRRRELVQNDHTDPIRRLGYN